MTVALEEYRRKRRFGVTTEPKGVDVPLPSLTTLTSPLTVQLRKTTGGTCWGAVFSFPPAKKNDAKTFKDAAD